MLDFEVKKLRDGSVHKFQGEIFRAESGKVCHVTLCFTDEIHAEKACMEYILQRQEVMIKFYGASIRIIKLRMEIHDRLESLGEEQPEETMKKIWDVIANTQAQEMLEGF